MILIKDKINDNAQNRGGILPAGIKQSYKQVRIIYNGLLFSCYSNDFLYSLGIVISISCCFNLYRYFIFAFLSTFLNSYFSGFLVNCEFPGILVNFDFLVCYSSLFLL